MSTAGQVSADDHRRRILGGLTPTAMLEVPLAQAGALVAARDVHALTAIPLFDNSAMDGYAVRARDVTDAGLPVTLPVVDDIPAGRTDPVALPAGAAIRIMTGAPTPHGCDAIVPLEATDESTSEVRIEEAPALGAHLRRAGEDLSPGDLVLTAGTRLGARHIGAAAAAGHGTLAVHARPRVAVISTGAELREPGTALAPGQIPDSNSYVLAAAVTQTGGTPLRIGALDDDEAALRETLERVSPDVDLIVLSGGISVGAYDVVKAVLSPLPSMWFGSVAMQPGKPQGCGHLPDGTPVIALPGNPVSVFVGCEVLVGPAVRALAGERETAPRFVPARAAVGWSSPAGREQYMPVAIDRAGATPLVHPASRRGSGSHLVGGLAAADGLARIPAEKTRVEAGQEIELLEMSR